MTLNTFKVAILNVVVQSCHLLNAVRQEPLLLRLFIVIICVL